MILGIIGTGMIGGSVGMRGKAQGWRVLGCDVCPEAAEQALACGAIDAVAGDDRIAQTADLIVIAAHVRGTIAEISSLRDRPASRAKLIVDVASVKNPIVRAAAGLRNFVGTHPMAGSERSGPQAASPALFEGRPWLFVPTRDPLLDDRARRFIVEMGALPAEIDAVEHDQVVALTSHVPQVIATLFSQRVRASDLEMCSGPVAKELARLGRSNAPMWADILDVNRDNVVRELRELGSAVLSAADALEGGRNLYVAGPIAR
jgi:prephenate dehydrogenase